jgi:hypothetical protein
VAAASGATPLFRFVQFEFPWELGPPPGRYVLRDHAGEADLRVLVIGLLGARPRRIVGRRRPRGADPAPEPQPVVTSRATLIRGQKVSEEEAKAWLADPWQPVPEELAVLNRVIAQYRVAAADPSVREVRVEQALVVRVGYGSGEQVAEGQWTAAVEPGERKTEAVRGRAGALRPQERLAALLGGRDAALACEELTLRARADLDAGREREAALQLRVALEAAIAELAAWRDQGDMALRISELRDYRGAVGDAANAALQGGLDEPTIDAVYDALDRVESALRARTAAGFG